MNEDAARILKLIEEGKITAEQGRTLIEALDEQDAAPEKAPAKNASPAKKNRMLRIVVDAVGPEKKDNARVRVNVPLDVAKDFVRLAQFLPAEAQEKMKSKGVDLEQINLAGLLDMFANGEIDENLVDVDAGDEKEGARVKIFID